MAFGGLCILAACVGIRWLWGTEEAAADPQAGAPAANRAAPAPAPAAPAAPARANTLAVVANVNGEEISRQELANECLTHYGAEVLDKLKNKYLIMLECQTRGVTVSQEEVNATIEQYAKRFGLPTQDWLNLLKEERGITPSQYASDIIWPMLALRKLAGAEIQVTDAELQKEFDSQYGPQIKARIIMCSDAKKAREIQAMAAQSPDQFGEMAAKFSEDPASASLKGLIQPIRKNVLNPQIEQAAFSLKDGQVSQVIQVHNQYVILCRESLIPARSIKLEERKQQLENLIRDRKERELAGKIFGQLEEQLKKNGGWHPIFTDPKLAAQYPGVAAYVGKNPITLQELGERCIERHGEQVLDGTINRRLIEQECRKKNLAVTDADVDQEIVRAASTMLAPKDGKPDVQGWLKMVTEQQGVSLEIYRRDSVWPSVALKKLIGQNVEVTQDDIQKGFEANYGPRVRCLAIIVENMKRAMEIWEKARQNPTAEYFGKLAEEYSIEASSRALKGQVPPIQKHGGQPKLEEEAFKLAPGQLSGIVQMAADKHIILYCLGQTQPKEVKKEDVRDLIYEEVREKKLRLAMAEYFQRLQDTSTVDNYLAPGQSRRPQTAPTSTTRRPAAPATPATR
jgi:parvulin-like peptidyl-prolyl isomerase